MVNISTTELVEKSESRLRDEIKAGDLAVHARIKDATKEMRRSREAMEKNNIQIELLTAEVKKMPDETGIRNIVKNESVEQLRAHAELCKIKNDSGSERLIGKAVLAVGAKIGGAGLGAGAGFAGVMKLLEKWPF